MTPKLCLPFPNARTRTRTRTPTHTRIPPKSSSLHPTPPQLVTPRWYHNFPDYEIASLQLQLLRKEVLLLSCASSRSLTDARKIIESCLDPPKARSVELAEAWLRQNKLIEPNPPQPLRTRRPLPPQPTSFGRLVDALPIDIPGAQLVLLGAKFGLLEEAVTLAVLRCTQPMVLKREPNKAAEYEALVRRYGPTSARTARADGFAEDEVLANLAAFLSFQRWYCDVQRHHRIDAGEPVSSDASSELKGRHVLLQNLRNRAELNGALVAVGKFNVARGRYEVQVLGGQWAGEWILVRRANLVEEEEAWCRERQLSHTSLLAVARTRAHVLDTLYRLSPPILQRHLGLRRPQPAPREAELTPQAGGPEDPPPPSLFSLLVSPRSARLSRKLLQTLRKAVQLGVAEEQEGYVAVATERHPCFFHLRKCCSLGDKCHFSHTQAEDRRPLCRFAMQGNCRFGAACKDRHPATPPVTVDEGFAELEELQMQVQGGFGAMMPLFASAELTGAVCVGGDANCLPPVDYSAFKSLLLLGEGDFTFAAALARKCKPKKASRRRKSSAAVEASPLALWATTDQTEDQVRRSHPGRSADALKSLRDHGAAVLFGVDARELDYQKALDQVESVAWNLPFSGVEQAEPNHLMMRAFFGRLARNALSRADSGQSPPRLFLTVSINQLADWGLLAAADDSFLQLDSVHKFEPADFDGYAPVRNDRDEPFDAGQVRTFGFSFDEPRLHASDPYVP